MTILPGLRDFQLKKGFKGEIWELEGGKFTRVAVVYGNSLDEMRSRKHAIFIALSGESKGKELWIEDKNESDIRKCHTCGVKFVEEKEMLDAPYTFCSTECAGEA